MDTIENVTPTNDDLAEALRNVAMLATLSISKWKGETTDHDATERVKRAEGARGNAGRFVKNILANADAELRDLCSTLDAARATHYALTLPWGGDNSPRGPRLLPNEMFMKYAAAMADHQNEVQKKLERLVEAYPEAVEKAKATLGGLAKDEDYPSIDEVKRRFAINFDWTPIPDTQGFKGLPDMWRRSLGQRLGERVRKMTEEAMASAWTTARERLTNCLNRMQDEKAVFKRSTIDKVNELPELMRGFNVTNDERMKDFAEWASQRFGTWDADTIREHASDRRMLAKVCTEGLEKLTGWGV